VEGNNFTGPGSVFLHLGSATDRNACRLNKQLFNLIYKISGAWGCPLPAVYTARKHLNLSLIYHSWRGGCRWSHGRHGYRHHYCRWRLMHGRLHPKKSRLVDIADYCIILDV